MSAKKEERRRFARYTTDADVYFHVTYEVKTKVDFQIVDYKETDTVFTKKHHAVSRNVSAEAMCFTAPLQLVAGTLLYLEVYLPKQREPIRMEGQVIWAEKVIMRQKDLGNFDTGVKLLTVKGRPVHETIYFDAENQVTWSLVLETIFGKFRKIAVDVEDKETGST